jgi:hypothetical protein
MHMNQQKSPLASSAVYYTIVWVDVKLVCAETLALGFPALLSPQ